MIQIGEHLILQIDADEKAQAAEEPRQEGLAEVCRLSGPEDQRHGQQHQRADEGPHPVEGQGPGILHALALGHEGGAPNESRDDQHQRADEFTMLHSPRFSFSTLAAISGRASAIISSQSPS